MSGLRDIILGETAISGIDGGGEHRPAKLHIAGYEVGELTARFSFEEVAGRLWSEDIDLTAARAEAFAWLKRDPDALNAPGPMEAIVRGLTRLPMPEDDAGARALTTAAVAVFGAAYWAQRHDRALDLGIASDSMDIRDAHAFNYLRLMLGRDPTLETCRALSTYWKTVVDHGLNASTFATRVVASTHADRVSALVAGLGALKGPLHGGAPGPVLDMLDEIGRTECAEDWIRRRLESGARIMGMGHRVYRARDPRATVLERALSLLPGEHPRRTLALAVEKEAEHQLNIQRPGRALRANVEFFTAVLLDAIGIPRELFTATFAASRVVGWNAHYDEQRASGTLIRPRLRYVGASP